MSKIALSALFYVLFTLSPTSFSQTTAFTYQGRLTDGGVAANGSYQMQFKLFDALSGGAQIGGTLSDIPATAADGVFTVNLDFGANALSGANRWLEIAVRKNSGDSYSTLAPREQIAAAPYAVRTLSAASADNALNLGGIPAGSYATTSSNAFVRNGLSLQSANMNIDGNGLFGGNVGVGTAGDQAKFSVSAGTAGIANNTAYFIAPNIGPNASNIHYGTSGDWYIRSAASSGKVVIQDTGGSVGIGTSGPAAKLTIIGAGPNGYSLGLTHDVGIGGQITQSRDKAGVPKAMLYVNGDGTIVRCYNGTTGSSSGNCGFDTLKSVAPGVYYIDFGFKAIDRFISVSVEDGGGSASASFSTTNSFETIVTVTTNQIGSGPSDRPFTIVLF